MSPAQSPRIAIVGAGFGGIGMAIALQRAGITSFEVFERADRVGGVWRENTYPGAGCDVPSPLYCFSFAPNPQWPRRYAKQASILAYLEHCVAEYGLGDRISLGTEVTRARFSETDNRWWLTVAGQTREFDVLIGACGQLSEPSTPRFPGIERFTGHSFHSADWDHAHDLRGRRVAVIGTGASAIQFVPEIASEVAQLTLLQRSAPFVLPKPDRQYSERHRARFTRLPALLAAERLAWFLLCEYGQLAVSEHPGWLAPAGRLARWHLRRAVSDPVKRRALEPDDLPGCKRLLFSNEYYRALARDNVEIIPESVASIGESSVSTSSGLTREVDSIIYATGFATHGFIAPMQVTGVGGADLAQDGWSAGASAHLGMTVPDFPNLFLLYGPNTNLGTGSIVHMLESQIRYVLDAVAQLERRPGSALAVRPEVAERSRGEMQGRLSRSVWATGCSSWYLDANGHNANNWPGTMREYRRRTRRLNREDYEVLEAPAPTRVEEAVSR
jgi:cation diffusion facilitator CzcD-associated flavoprotein CzcO